MYLCKKSTSLGRQCRTEEALQNTPAQRTGNVARSIGARSLKDENGASVELFKTSSVVINVSGHKQ